MTSSLATRVAELTESGVAFVQATVVRAQHPSSARAGDRALILADGSVEGFVGGHCAEGSVRTAALGALGSGQSLLLRVLPDGTDTFPDSPGASVVVNPCLSGGALEIYLEPLLPAPVLRLVGSSPIVDALEAQGRLMDFRVERAADTGSPRAATAVVVASHDGGEAHAVREALDAGVGFVGVVCSRTRGEAILAAVGPDATEAARVHLHVGLDIGARTAPEVACSILAGVVRAIRVEGLVAPGDPAAGPPAPARAVDPVCGMTVTVTADTPHATADGVDHWFCMPGCRSTFLEEHAS